MSDTIKLKSMKTSETIKLKSMKTSEIKTFDGKLAAHKYMLDNPSYMVWSD